VTLRGQVQDDFLANGEGLQSLQIAPAFADVSEGVSKAVSLHLIAARNETVGPLEKPFFKAAIIGRSSDRLEEGGSPGENIHSGFNPFQKAKLLLGFQTKRRQGSTTKKRVKRK
jgi:hypothetical protein